MTRGGVIYLLPVFGVFSTGLTSPIETRRIVRAEVGDDAHFSCQLLQSKDVVQVTWKKLSSRGEKSLASYTSRFGERVSSDVRDKVEFTAAGLQSSSIVIKKVSEEDEGCYHCMFNTYPEGVFTAATCLQLCELHEPALHVGRTNSSEEAVVSCSATGRPDPAVTLRVLTRDVHLSNSSSVRVTNTNGTVTVTTTAVLSGIRDNSTQVGCVVRVFDGPQLERFLMVPGVKRSSADESYQSGSDNNDVYFMLLVGFSCVCFTAVGVFAVLLTWKYWNRNKPKQLINVCPPSVCHRGTLRRPGPKHQLDSLLRSFLTKA
uniref:OX-2 membrane glycoprotein-like isoform X2 n=1 Tax=Scatophagus argus TaxID=75038 RepID=UPI001ED7D0AD|nr:OX-2 membrane glycoprotein-like isoform X2 [Scatophagus argus]